METSHLYANWKVKEEEHLTCLAFPAGWGWRLQLAVTQFGMLASWANFSPRVFLNYKIINSIVPPDFGRGAQRVDLRLLRGENRQAALWAW